MGLDSNNRIAQAERNSSMGKDSWALHTRAILSSIADGVVTTDLQGHVEYLNPAAEELTGWHLQQAKGLPLDEVLNIVGENSRTPIIDPVHRCLKDGSVVLG
jgi:PAS domain-containing protein